MAIHTDRYTHLTNDFERKLVQLGGGDPDRLIPRQELSGALVKAIETIDAHDPELLVKLWARISASLTPEERIRLQKLVATLGQE